MNCTTEGAVSSGVVYSWWDVEAKAAAALGVEDVELESTTARDERHDKVVAAHSSDLLAEHCV